MGNELVFANLLKVFFLITSPITFLVGIFLFFDVDTYTRIEKFLTRSFGFSKMRLSKPREFLQMFLLKRRRIIGIICLINSLAVLIVVNFLLKRY